MFGGSSVAVPSLSAVALVLDSLLCTPRGPIPDPDQPQSGEALSRSRRQSPALRAQSAAQRTESPSPSQPLQSRRRAGGNDTRPSLRREGATGSSRSVGRQLRLAPALAVYGPDVGPIGTLGASRGSHVNPSTRPSGTSPRVRTRPARRVPRELKLFAAGRILSDP